MDSCLANSSSQYATSILQNLYYRVTISAGRRHPQPGEPLYAYHHRRIRIVVLSLYLLYTLFQSLYDVKMAGDFYILLGVTPYSSERDIKAKFRRLAAKFHPDKIRENNAIPSTPSDLAFVQLKLAQDTIIDPAKRFAYDRFGPVVVRVQHPNLKTIRDYVYAGLRAKVPEYASNAIMLIVLNYVWLPQWGRFWRYFAVAVMAFLELYFLTHAFELPPQVELLGRYLRNAAPDLLPPHLLPFQVLTIARRLSMSLNIFISQLAPPAARSKAAQDQQMQQQIAHLSQATGRVDAEATNLLQLGLTPFKGEAEKVRSLREGMTESLMMGAVRNNPEVRQAVEQVLARRANSGSQLRP